MGEDAVAHKDSTDSKIKELTTSSFPFQLTDVRLFQVSTERHVPEQEGEEPPSLSILLIKGEEPPTASEFGLLLELEVALPHSDAPECRISLSMEGRFEAIVDPATLKPSAIERFKEADAILLLWPYMREALHDLTDRMRLGIPPLPVIDARALLTRSVGKSVTEEELFESESM